MKQFAFINDNGSVVYITSPGNDEDYVDGQTYGDYVAKEIPHDVDGSVFIRTQYFKNEEWREKPTKPSDHYNWDLTSESWVLDHERLMKDVRQLRDQKLFLCDWTQIPDAPLTAEQKSAWSTYRQELRDVPINNTNVTSREEVVWPTMPA